MEDIDSPTWRSEKRWTQRGSTARVILLLLLWYLSSVLTSITTKEILGHFPYPITVATVQQAVAAFFGWCTAQMERRGALQDWRLHLRTFAPVAIPMVVALISYRWALMSASVAFTSTVKTLGPVFTILFSRIMLQARCVAIDPSDGSPAPAPRRQHRRQPSPASRTRRCWAGHGARLRTARPTSSARPPFSRRVHRSG